MRKKKTYEDRVHDAYEKGNLISTSPSKEMLRQFEKSARTTVATNQRGYKRIFSQDLS